MFGVSRAEGKSFTRHSDAEYYYKEHSAAGLVEKVGRPVVGAAAVNSVAALNAENFELSPDHYPQIPVENPWGGRMGAYVVFRGRAPGLYRSW